MWLHARGSEMTEGDWHDQALRTLGIWFGKRTAIRSGAFFCC
jgi:hypothetical protein